VGKCAWMKLTREIEPHKKVDNDLCSPLVTVHVQYPLAIFYNADMDVLGFKLTSNGTPVQLDGHMPYPNEIRLTTPPPPSPPTATMGLLL
jgi:hypothetical protein